MGTISEDLPSAQLVLPCMSVSGADGMRYIFQHTDLFSTGFGNLGGVIAGFSYRSRDSPRYFQGHGLLIGTVTMSFFLSLFMHLYLVRENKRRDAAMQAKGLTKESYTEEMKLAERELGDYASVSTVPTSYHLSATHTTLHQFFRYTE